MYYKSHSSRMSSYEERLAFHYMYKDHVLIDRGDRLPVIVHRFSVLSSDRIITGTYTTSPDIYITPVHMRETVVESFAHVPRYTGPPDDIVCPGRKRRRRTMMHLANDDFYEAYDSLNKFTRFKNQERLLRLRVGSNLRYKLIPKHELPPEDREDIHFICKSLDEKLIGKARVPHGAVIPNYIIDNLTKSFDV